MVRYIVAWWNKKDEQLDEDLMDESKSRPKIYAKAFGLGFIDGVIDMAFLYGMFVIAKSLFDCIKAIFKK